MRLVYCPPGISCSDTLESDDSLNYTTSFLGGIDTKLHLEINFSVNVVPFLTFSVGKAQSEHIPFNGLANLPK